MITSSLLLNTYDNLPVVNLERLRTILCCPGDTQKHTVIQSNPNKIQRQSRQKQCIKNKHDCLGLPGDSGFAYADAGSDSRNASYCGYMVAFDAAGSSVLRAVESRAGGYGGTCLSGSDWLTRFPRSQRAGCVLQVTFIVHIF